MLIGRDPLYMDLAFELQKIYDSEINVEIGWFWDGGIEVRLGDRMNGYLAEETVRSAIEIVPWLQEAIAHFYPESEYADALDAEIRERAVRRVFCPPRIGARVFCPDCGAPNPSPDFDQVIAFVCSRCGNSVLVPAPKVQ